MSARSFSIRKRLIAVHKLIADFDRANPPPKRVRIDVPHPVRPVLSTAQKVEQLDSLGHSILQVHRMSGTILRCRACMRYTPLHKWRALADTGICLPLSLQRSVSIRDSASTYDSSMTLKRPSPLSLPHSLPVARLEVLGAPGAYPPTPKSDESVPPTVGHTTLHRTHNLLHPKGIIICSRCGYYTVLKPDCLAKPCRGFLSKSGNEFIRRWQRGLTPKSKMPWPESFSDLSEGLIHRSSDFLKVSSICN